MTGHAFLISLAAVALSLNACSENPARANNSNASAYADPEHKGVMNIRADDAAMEAAKRKGRETLPAFFRHLAAPAANEADFSIKFNLTPKDADPEFIWGNDIERKNGQLTARLGNDPIAEGFKLGDRVPVDEASVIDWGYTRDGVMQGHHTTRVLLDEMPADEAGAIRQALGWKP